MTKRLLLAAAALLAAVPASAALQEGARVPSLVTQGALAGRTFNFNLQQELRKGPVVLYFFPKAFTAGCTIEAHAFAEATPRFQALGATVIGVSSDDIETLKRFSVEACRNQFAVAADAQAKVIQAYDAASLFSRNRAARVSYVIDRSGRIVFTHDGMSPEGHIEHTLKAVERLHQQAGRAPSADQVPQKVR